MSVYVDGDKQAFAQADEAENGIDAFTAQMADNHIKRLSEGVCTPETGAQYLSLASNAERIADHFMNVANTVRRALK